MTACNQAMPVCQPARACQNRLKHVCLHTQLEFGAATGQHMLLDAATIDALELVRPNTKGAPGGQRSGWGARKSKQYSTSSLLGFLDQTSTVPGARLLRTNVLQPLTSVATLEMRLDAVQELLESPHLSLQLVELLEQRLPKNLDKVCACIRSLCRAECTWQTGCTVCAVSAVALHCC